jgi:hypothetical protein
MDSEETIPKSIRARHFSELVSYTELRLNHTGIRRVRTWGRSVKSQFAG